MGMNLEFIANSKSSDSLTKLTTVLTSIITNKGATGTNGEVTCGVKFVKIVSKLVDLLEESLTEANIQKHCKMLIFKGKGEIKMNSTELDAITAFSEIITKKTEEINLSIEEIEKVYEETFNTTVSSIKSSILFVSEDGSGFVKGETAEVVADDESSGVIKVNLKMKKQISSIVKQIIQSISVMVGAKQ